MLEEYGVVVVKMFSPEVCNKTVTEMFKEMNEHSDISRKDVKTK